MLVETEMDAIDVRIPSDLNYIHTTVRKVEQFLDGHGMENKWKISVVLWELLSNAITHGNKNVPAREVKCLVTCEQDGIVKIVVEDEGVGFDYHHLDSALPIMPRHIQKRGYVLIHSICRGVSFNENGNRVTAVLDDCKDPMATGVR